MMDNFCDDGKATYLQIIVPLGISHYDDGRPHFICIRLRDANEASVTKAKGVILP